MRGSRVQKLIILFTLVVLVSSTMLVVPQPAQAQFGGIVSVVSDIPGLIWRSIDKALKIASDVFFRNQLNRYLQNLAYNAAIKVATGEAGQKPLFFDMQEVLTTAADQAAGEFAQELLVYSSGGGQCEITELDCTSAIQCKLIALSNEAEPVWTLVNDDEDYERSVKSGILKNGTLRRERCVPADGPGILGVGGLDLCRPLSPIAEIRVKTMGLNSFNDYNAPPPRCSFNKIINNVKDLRNISTGGLIEVTEIFNAQSNEIGAILNINREAVERRSFAIAQQALAVAAGRGIKSVEDAVTGKTKTPSLLVGETFTEGLVRTPLSQIAQQTGSIAADAIGVFVNTLAGKLLENVFDKGFNPATEGSFLSQSLFGFSGVAAAKLKFADLLTPLNIRRGGTVNVLQQLASGCDEVNQSFGGGGIVDLDEASKQINNCVIDTAFSEAIDRRLTVRQALELGYLDGTKDFGVHDNGTGSNALAGNSCNGCDPHIYSLRSMLILRKYRVIPVGWELAARYIKDVLQPNLTNAAAKRDYSLQAVLNGYDNADSPFYRLLDPDWQLKLPDVIAWRQGPGENIATEIITPVDLNGDGKIEDSERQRFITRASYTADEKSCIYEKPDGTCFYGYCTEEKPVWRIAGESCAAEYVTCQTYLQADVGSQVSLLNRTTDQSYCSASNVGCRRYALGKDTVSGAWLDTAVNSGGQDIYIDRTAPVCAAAQAGCAEFVRLTDLAGAPLSAPAVETNISTIQAAGGQVSDYGSLALVEKVYLSGKRLDCRSSVDTDGNGLLDENVACRLYTPQRGAKIAIPGVVEPADVADDGSGNLIVTNWNGECPSACAGYQSFNEVAFAPLYPATLTKKFIASTGRQCPAQAEGCTEFTNLDVVAKGGEGLEYYTNIRQCVTENDPAQATYYTWEGAEETGFQLRSWQLVSGGPGGGPLHAGDSDYQLCSEYIFNLPPGDPQANPDCREYLEGDLNSSQINRYYRLHARVIFASADCHPLRRTGVVDAATCTAAGGTWQGGNGCLYMTIPSQSRSCAPANNNCRRYQGPGAGNVRTVISSSFENGIDGWSTQPPGNGSLSPESVVLGGHSLAVSGGSLVHSVAQLQPRAYLLSFWAKGSGTLQAQISDEAAGQTTQFAGAAALTGEWNEYKLGPAIVGFQPAGGSQLTISGLGGSFIDNIVLSEVDDLFLLDRSWTTPLSCDINIDADSTNPQVHAGTSNEAQLFCQEYRDDKNQTKFVKKFTRLCQEEFVGCEALVETYNSDSVLAESFPQSLAGATMSVPADTLAFYVNDKRYSCPATSAGCTELGLAFVDRAAETGGVYGATFQSSYRVLEPDNYVDSAGAPLTLCYQEENLCDEFAPSGTAGPAATKQYFKEPQDRTCEFRRNVVVTDPNSGAAQVYPTAWVKSGVSLLTPSDVCQTGGLYPDQISNAPVCNFDYAANSYTDPVAADNSGQYDPGCYSYSCPNNASSCTEFQDPLEPEGCDPSLPAGAVSALGPACNYYYYKQDSLLTGIAECNGVIDPAEGCVPFWQTSESDKFLYGDCQSKCPFRVNPVTQTPILVGEAPNCQPDNVNGKPGCLNQYLINRVLPQAGTD